MSVQLPQTENVLYLPANAAAAGMARRELAATAGIAGDVAYKALLMTSELIAVYVADIVPAADSRLRLTIRVTPERVRIEVAGPAPPVSPDVLLHSRETPSLGGRACRSSSGWPTDGASRAAAG
jgi:hypothetical protein